LRGLWASQEGTWLWRKRSYAEDVRWRGWSRSGDGYAAGRVSAEDKGGGQGLPCERGAVLGLAAEGFMERDLLRAPLCGGGSPRTRET
jgi:hypothetical protein